MAQGKTGRTQYIEIEAAYAQKQQTVQRYSGKKRRRDTEGRTTSRYHIQEMKHRPEWKPKILRGKRTTGYRPEADKAQGRKEVQDIEHRPIPHKRKELRDKE